MTGSSTHSPLIGSATIYQFPLGGRAGIASQSHSGDAKQQTMPTEFVSTDAWYHQEAIRDANASTKQ